ncbi:MAG: MerR family transcriptional regulator [Burkholderiales bacterium PBB1]|nr:MAG: MerR family transcriptional regulator [Burkholderiales bacterium PBB1]
MNEHTLTVTHGVIVEESLQFTLIELSQACQTDSARLIELVEEGALIPSGSDASSWRFDGSALRRASAAVRLARDLHLNAAGVALVLDLLDEVDTLRSQLRQLGHGAAQR